MSAAAPRRSKTDEAPTVMAIVAVALSGVSVAAFAVEHPGRRRSRR